MRKRVAPRLSSAMRGHRRIVCVTAASAALLVPLLIDRSDDSGPPDRRLQDDYTAAADEFHVPRGVLMGVSYLQSRWDSHQGAPSVVGGYGPMHLVDSAGLPAETPPHHVTPHPKVQKASPSPAQKAAEAALRSADLRRAAVLVGLPVERLRTEDAANVRGGAALLAEAQRSLGKPLSTDPADWWDAVSRFPGTTDAGSAAAYANDVFDIIRRGADRVTDAGQHVVLAASPRVRPHAGAAGASRSKNVECPAELPCSWLSAPYVRIDDEAYGNHDLADRPKDQRIEYIVIHDTEAPLASMLLTVQDPTEASWHYSIRSSDGSVTQHVRTKDAAWHSGSQFVNGRSIGIEHEGFLRQPNAWYTEQMYRSSARLVRYLTKRYDIPLDRQHIFGHDNVPAPTEETIPDMHDDPGPFWDWRHYFDLLGAPLKATAGPDSDTVMILPEYAKHRPVFTGCVESGEKCAPHGSSAVRLHTEPSEDSSLIQDPGRKPDGDDTTVDVNDLGSRVSAGQLFAVAGRQGDWTAIWFQGHKAWFKNPKDQPTAVGARARTVTPKEGRHEIPVFGRALPEESAYPEGMDEQQEAPLPYTIDEGQRYVTQSRVQGSYIDRSSFGDSPAPVVRGQEEYYEIQLDHRLAYVRASDVDVQEPPAAAGAPKKGTAKSGK